MNSVVLMGRLCNTPSVYGDENIVVKFNLAVDRKYKKDNEESTDFISCVAFGKTAEFIQKYFDKGSKICLSGRIQTGNYTNKEGKKVYTTDVVAENVEFAEAKLKEPTKKEEGFVDALEDEGLPFN